MKAKLNCVLLIDDSEHDNFFHERTIMKVGCAQKIVAVESGQAALDYLKSEKKGNHPGPTLYSLTSTCPL